MSSDEDSDFESPPGSDIEVEDDDEEYDDIDFHDLEPRPLPEDLISPERVRLPKNAVEHAYNDLDHYLNVQFRLLREDMEDEETEQSYFLFQGVTLSGLRVDQRTGLDVRTATFQTPNASNKDQEWMNKLIYHQCVCLSSDEFTEEALIAYVVSKDVNFAENRSVQLRFFNDTGRLIRIGVEYVMIEPDPYFLMYHFVLKNLQKITDLPLTRYLVEGNPDIQPPTYMRGERKELEEVTLYGQDYKISELHESFTSSIFDESQRQALCSALTRELAIIQGPPGTGKTHIGVEIIRRLLENRTRWGITTPILVVCYTNHALDQFMERIKAGVEKDLEEGVYSHDGPALIRFGNRGTSVILEGHLKPQIMQKHRNVVPNKERQQALKYKKYAQNALRTAFVTTVQAPVTFLSVRALEEAMQVKHLEQLEKFSDVRLPYYGNRQHSNSDIMKLDQGLALWLLGKDSGRLGSVDIECEGDLGKVLKDRYRRHEKLLKHAKRGRTYDVDSGWEWGDNLADLFGVTLLASATEEEKNIRRGIVRARPEGPDAELIVAVNEIFEEAIQTDGMTAEEEKEARHIRDLGQADRWALYVRWLNKTVKTAYEKLPSLIEDHQKACEAFTQARETSEAELYRNALVIGATTTRVAMFREHMVPLEPKIIVIEEAAEVLEGHIISSLLPSVEHAILIGDQQQLRPKPCVHDLAVRYKLDISMFERLVKRGVPYTTLLQQHRMLPVLTAAVVKPFFYKDLEDAPVVHEYPEVAGLQKSFFFYSYTDQFENTTSTATSHWNFYEATMAVHLAHYIHQQGHYKHKQITVLCTYSSQTGLVKKLFREQIYSNLSEDQEPPIAVETVDGFQGKENDIIILSLVRAPSRYHRGVGFLKVQNRITVALTRARHGFYIIGNGMYLAQNSEFWSNIIKSLKDKGHYGFELPIVCQTHGHKQNIRFPNDFLMKAPNGGCTLPCEGFMTCGHGCAACCHIGEDLHDAQFCKEVTKRIFEGCFHEVSIRCQEEHEKCPKPCERTPPCGHPCKRSCGEECFCPVCEAPEEAKEGSSEQQSEESGPSDDVKEENKPAVVMTGLDREGENDEEDEDVEETL